MNTPALARLRSAVVATGGFFERLEPRGWVMLVVLSAFSAALPVAATIGFGARPPGGITRVLAREAPGVVETLRSVPKLAVIPGALAVVALAGLYVHSVAETALVRALRGGGPGIARTLGVGTRLFAVRVGLVVGLLAVLAAIGAAVGQLLADPVDAIQTAVAASGSLLVVLVPVALAVDLLAVEVAVPVVLADREPERKVGRPEAPDSEEWGSAAWWREQVESGTVGRSGRSGSAGGTTAGTGSGWSSGRDHLGPRGMLSASGDLWRVATRNRRRFLGVLATRLVLEAGVWVATGLAFYVFVLVVVLLGFVLTIALLFLVTAVGAPPWIAVVGFLLGSLLSLGAVAVLTSVVHAPLRAYTRYYGMLVAGDLDPDLDAVPERKAAVRIRGQSRSGDGTGGGSGDGTGSGSDEGTSSWGDSTWRTDE